MKITWSSSRTVNRRIVAAAALSMTLLQYGLFSAPAYAGCGCQKPPPELAAIRPNATYSGTPITLFNSSFIVGNMYSVDFISSTGTTSTVSATVVSRRDLADGLTKPQLVVTVPNMAIGPASVRVRNCKSTVMSVSDDAFTVVPLPIAVSQDVGSTSYKSFKAAIGRDGTFYISLDMTAVTLPRVFRAQAKGYPLTFTSEDVVFYNIQGFHMQLLNADMPGLYSVESANNAVDSDILGYSRHEFSTFYLQHEERQVHQILDGNWHVDGTRHVDHNHLILAISGRLSTGSAPAPGVTPSFTLVLDRFTLFQNGLVGTATATTSIDVGNNSTTDSYDSRTNTFAHRGDVLGYGTVSVSGYAVVDGNATGNAVKIASTARVTGAITALPPPGPVMPVKVPDLLPDLGRINLGNYQTQTIGTGSYRVSQIALANSASLYIDNCTGPVTLYVTGAADPAVQFSSQSRVTTCDPNPEKFAIYIASNASVTLKGQGTFHGVVYAPQSAIAIGASGEFFGAFVGNTMQTGGSAKVHFDTALKAP